MNCDVLRAQRALIAFAPKIIAVALSVLLIFLVMPGKMSVAETQTEQNSSQGNPTGTELPSITCKAAVNGKGSQLISCAAGSVVGSTSGKNVITSISFVCKGASGPSLEYKTYRLGKGWSDYVSSGASGSTKKSNPVQAIRIKLKKNVAQQYDIYYRVNLIGYGWTGWAKNGEAAGSVKLGDMRAYQVKLVHKNAKAPGSTKNCYFVIGKESAEQFYARGGLTRTQVIASANKAKGTGLKKFSTKYNLNSAAGKKLKSTLKKFSHYRLSFVMVDLKTGQGICYNPGKVQYIASSIKGPYIAAINRYRPSGVTRGVRSTMSSTIKVSSNEGYSSLRSRFGHGIMANMMNYCGIRSSEMESHRNYPYMNSRTLAKLWVGTYWSYYRQPSKQASWARELYAHPLNSFIDQALSKPTRSKPGWYPGGGYNVQNDAGVVLASNHPYVVSVMSSACDQYGLLRSLVRAIDGVHEDMVS